MVSVDPIIVDVINPILLSTPYVFIIFVAIASDALPEIGLNIASGITSLGKPILDVIPDNNTVIMFNIPELLSAPIAKNSPKRVGNIFITLIVVAIIIAAYVLINWGVEKLEIQDVDFTADKIYSITQPTKDKLANLNKDVILEMIKE